MQKMLCESPSIKPDIKGVGKKKCETMLLFSVTLFFEIFFLKIYINIQWTDYFKMNTL